MSYTCLLTKMAEEEESFGSGEEELVKEVGQKLTLATRRNWLKRISISGSFEKLEQKSKNAKQRLIRSFHRSEDYECVRSEDNSPAEGARRASELLRRKSKSEDELNELADFTVKKRWGQKRWSLESSLEQLEAYQALRASNNFQRRFSRFSPERKLVEIRSPESGKCLFLDRGDMSILRQSWLTIPDQLVFVRDFFQKLFQLRPPLKCLYDFPPTTDQNQLIDDPASDWSPSGKFLTIGKRYTNFLALVVGTLTMADSGDSPAVQLLLGTIRQVGVRHSEFRGVSFTADNWLSFKTALLETICSYAEDASEQTLSYIVWSKVLTFLITEMKDAFCSAVRERVKVSP